MGGPSPGRNSTLSFTDDAAWARRQRLHQGESEDLGIGPSTSTSTPPAHSHPSPSLADSSRDITSARFPDRFADDASGHPWHGRVVSSASTTDGDVGRMRYAQLASPLVSSEDLTGGVIYQHDAPRPSLSTLGNTPMARDHSAEGDGGGRDGYFASGDDGGDQEIMLSPSSASQWASSSPALGPDGNASRYSQAPIVGSPDEVDEEGTIGLATGGRGPRSSADIYHAAGGDSGVVGGLRRIGKSIRRASRRIVDFDASNQEGGKAGAHVLIPDQRDEDDSSDDEGVRPVIVTTGFSSQSKRPQRPSHVSTLRGKSLGIFGPDSNIRRAAARLLDNDLAEPTILILIIANVVLLVIQAAPDVFKFPRKQGYFDYWVDYALLAVFSIFTVEIVARILVSGLIINPPPLDIVPVESPGESDMPKSRATDGSGGSTTPPALSSQASPPPFHRRENSRSNTLDTFAELGDSIKSRAERFLRASEPGEEGYVAPGEDSYRRSTRASRAYSSEGGVGMSRDASSADEFGTAPQPHPRHQRFTSAYEAYKARRSLNPSRQSTLLMLGHHHRHGSRTAPGSEAPTAATTTSGATAGASTGSDATTKARKTAKDRLKAAPFAEAIRAQRQQATHYAYLRHSWNRVDLIAVVCFWVTFSLAMTRTEMQPSLHLYVFRALSVLRAARLLTLTSGTSTILESLKVAAPLLVNVTFFILFAMLTWAIIGVQAFKGSYRRNCVWVGDAAPGPEAMAGTNFTLSQLCGGHIDPGSLQAVGAQLPDGRPTSRSPKGFVCPLGQICVEADSNPNNNTQAFDNLFLSLLQVVVLISSNNWSGVMYNMIDADYFASFLFFIAGIVLLNFWLANLLVAVITNTFAAITSETKQSAFAAERVIVSRPASTEEEDAREMYRRRVASVYKRIWGYTKLFWLAAIVADLAAQASRASSQTKNQVFIVESTELGFTIAFAVEILLRFIAFVLDRDWRGFFRSTRNRVDLGLAVITCIIQIPAIKDSEAYPWLTFFQLARFYRVIAAIPRMNALLIRVFGSMSGLFNMIVFLLMMVGLGALIAVQLFRGDIQQTDDSGENVEINFKHIYNSFVGMYQVFTSENWTNVLYAALSNEKRYKQAVLTGIFICGWFLFANFIVLQMFIAVINEGLSIAEGQKRAQQLEVYLKRMEPPPKSLTDRLLHELSPYRWLRERNERKARDQAAAALAEAEGTSAEKQGSATTGLKRLDLRTLAEKPGAKRFIKSAKRFVRLDEPEEQVPMDAVRARQLRQSFSGEAMLRAASEGGGGAHSRKPSMMTGHLAREDVGSEEAMRLFARERRLERMRSGFGLSRDEKVVDQAAINAEHAARHAADDDRLKQARLINAHPSYEKSLWLFSSRSRFRRFCQSIVPPSYGHRLFGRPPARVRRWIYQSMLFSAIVGSIVVASIASPSYRKAYYVQHGMSRLSWFTMTEVLLSLLFFLEFIIKVIADGFAFTPNAYLLSPWNALDLFVMASLLVNVTSELIVIGGVSRFTRSLKAFRALRLINLSDFMRNAFLTVLAGSRRFVDASILAVLYIVPYAVWGQNLFSGLLYSCNDGSAGIATKFDCHGEYSASPSQWTFLAPRVWHNPTEGSRYSFDDFRSALLILFEIVSLEGWIDVMTKAMSIVGFNEQTQTDSMQINALFFIIYNLIGAVFVLTLFVSVIIESTRQHSGAAFFTTEQLQWIDLKRLIARQRPSKRPKVRPENPVRAWCYDRAIRKHGGWWAKSMTVLYLANTILLATTTYETDHVVFDGVSTPRDIAYLIFASCFACDLLVRVLGLGFRHLGLWDAYDLVVVSGIISTTLAVTVGKGNPDLIQIQEVFLTLIVIKLIQKSNALNQLFRTAIASLPSIGSLFLLWLVAFLVWAIAFLEVFGTSRWGEHETWRINFQSMPAVLLFLAMCSTGEGWNQFMHDYVHIVKPRCTPSSNYLYTDCGSAGWAYFLFISWNILSMYLFLNLFTGTVVENFSYLFQGAKPLLGRTHIRAYKKHWSRFDPRRTGYLAPQHLVPFLVSLRGILDVRIWPDEGRVSALRKEAQDKAIEAWRAGKPSRTVAGLDLDVLEAALSRLDYNAMLHRRRRFDRIHAEAMLAVDEEKGGVNFNVLLEILAHHCLVEDDEALALEELVARRRHLERVEDRLEMDRVRGFLRGLWWRRRFLALREERLRMEAGQRLTGQGQVKPSADGVPSIHVDEGTKTPDLDSATLDRSSSRPDLRLDTSSSRSSPFLSPRSREAALPGGGGGLAISPSLEDIEERITPTLESFQQTAWGGIARRLSDDAERRPEGGFSSSSRPSSRGGGHS